MRLGNSNGKNKGMRYFIRGRDDLDTSIRYVEEAELFSKWMSKNIESTKAQLQNKGHYDDDIFNETYLRIYEIILFTNRKIKDYASYFHRSYFTNHIQIAMKEKRYCELFDNAASRDEYPNMIDDDEEKQEEMKRITDKENLVSKSFDFVRENFTQEEYEIYFMYITGGLNYNQITKITGYKYHIIQRLIASIKCSLRDNEELTSERKQIS